MPKRTLTEFGIHHRLESCGLFYKKRLWKKSFSDPTWCGHCSEIVCIDSWGQWCWGGMGVVTACRAASWLAQGRSQHPKKHAFLIITLHQSSTILLLLWKGIRNVRFSIFSTFQEKQKTVCKLEFWLYIKKIIKWKMKEYPNCWWDDV